MPSAFRNSKDLPNWFELHYFRWPSSLRRLRRTLIWGTFILTLLIVGALFAFPSTSPAFQAGPVCEAHSMFNNRCEECHKESFQTPLRFMPWNSDVRAVSDDACTKCHEGPKHNALQTRDPSCASCHREHRGKISLKHMEDSHCTDCHSDLPGNRNQPGKPNFANVSKFPKDHPEFAIFGDNIPPFVRAQKLHFNHQVHLQAEGVLTQRNPEKKKLLNCASCHEMDVAGQYMQPVNYEKHCSECHPLSVQVLGVKDGGNAELREAIAQFNKTPAPHKAPEVVRAVMRDRLLEFAQKYPLVLDPTGNEGGVPKSRPLDATRDLKEWIWAQGEVKETDRVQFLGAQVRGNINAITNAGGCRYCHPLKVEPKEEKGVVSLPVYEPTNVPLRWMQHARFSHRGHQMLNCAECHKANESKVATDVMMPDKSNCAKCHNPSVGLRHDCVDCHNYHDRSKGVTNRNLTIDQCLGK